ncbi:MAG TPA: porin [Candidatus Kapabacteria bacterium]|nr:porin [Candidatus Kapabacteria bacterium]
MITRLSAALLCLILSLAAQPSVAQTDTSDLTGKVDGLTERTATLESTVDKLNKLKITGYIQPQWVWGDTDSLGNANANRNYFTIRRGRIKLQHSTGDFTYVLYPDITERGVEMKEVWVSWQMIPELAMTLGAMNRPFGYEIAYSSSSREVAERSLAEQRLFAGERDLGLQFALNPTIIEGFTPALEFGLFNGSDNYGQGPVSLIPGSNRHGFTYGQIIGSRRANTPVGADSLMQVFINRGLTQDSLLSNAGSDGGIKQNQKEIIGHLRLPFLISDEFSFDVGGSWSIGGIAEPSDMIGEYTGANGALVLANSGTQADANYNVRDGEVRSGLFFSNRTIFGADAQLYFSVLPIGGTIVKAEMYTGQVPFYGSSALFTASDTASFGTPRASTVLKNVFGYYAMIVQNITDDLQLALRYDAYDPNTDVEGKDFAFVRSDNTVGTLRGVNASTSFGGDLAQSTVTVALNAYLSGNVRLMLNYDHPVTEDYTRNRGGLQTVSDANDDRVTVRMQYKF